MTEPKKALKHRLLVENGIEDAEEFKRTKFFYDINDLQKCLNETEKRYETDADYKSGFNMINLVSDTKTQGQPNFLFNDLNELREVKSKLKDVDLADYSQVWHVRNRPNENAIWGRIGFNIEAKNDTIELVKGSSIRQVDKYPNVDVGYMRIEKTKNFESSPFSYYKTTETIIKKESGNQLLEDRDEILNLIAGYKYRLGKFSQVLKSHGAQEVSFDFNYSQEGGIQFYDFDTDNDKAVLDSIIKQEEKERE
jgi:hypothetical protein